MEQQACTHVRIPLIVPSWRHLDQIETDDLFSTCSQARQEVGGFLEPEPARDRGACVGAQRGVQPIDIEGDVHLLRQPLDDGIALFPPRHALELLPADLQ